MRGRKLELKRIYLEPVHAYAYQRPNCNSPLITGLVLVESESQNERICFELTYEDGFKDYVPVCDVDAGHYKFITME